MKIFGSKAAWAGALLLLAGCGLLQVGSRFVKSQPFKAQAGGILSVAATENAMLGGLRLEVPPGALLTDTTITVELGLTDLTDSTWAAGPAVVLGPSNLTFATDALLVLPVAGLESDSKISVAGIDGEGSSFVIDPSRVTVDAKAGLISFKIRRLGSFQARAEERCRGVGSCGDGRECNIQTNRCEWPDAGCVATPEICNGIDDDCNGIIDDPLNAFCASDGGPAPVYCGTRAGWTCPAGFDCVDDPSGVCTLGSDCPGICVPAFGDGGSACVPRIEVCNGIDDDCNGIIDDPLNAFCAPDAGTDRDGGLILPACVPQIEICNGIDDDCNGTIDDVPRGSC